LPSAPAGFDNGPPHACVGSPCEFASAGGLMPCSFMMYPVRAPGFMMR